MRELTSRERRHLRGLAHHLDPVVIIGKGGLSEPVRRQIERALSDHELIKVRFLEGKPDKAAIAALEEETTCRSAGVVGHIAVLFREQSEPEKRKIRLPS